ncbi:MAG TPA: UDP-N-acetylglucosamine 1-carboxyvinyltransferase [Luteitalea sp.]|nr:UDP-N-acetylglucosamine 1-carboxyvinyltransferase [Luteitalea sp.]
MSVLRVEGGRPLEGVVTVEGNKNAALPLIVASLLTTDAVTLHNVPRIRDVDVLLDLLEGLGSTVDGRGTSTLTLRGAAEPGIAPDPVLVGKVRASMLLMGPLLARRGEVQLAPPGGDFPSRRTLTTHVQALQALGARQVEGAAHAFEAPRGLRGGSFYLDEASVTATELALLAAVTADGETDIRHAATEPHVVELCTLLSAMGAQIEGAGTSRLRIHGAQRLGGATHTLRGDYIEAGTWAVIGAVTLGSIDVRGAEAEDMEPIVSVLHRMQVPCRVDGGRVQVTPGRCVGMGRLVTGLWPAFPSDMVSLFTVLATQAEGRTLIHDWMYELRLFALEQLSGMRADIFLCDSHRMVVTGQTPLRGRHLDTRDLRSGMALIAAALAADGESVVGPLETVERGYALVVERLTALGAQVSREG